MLQGWLPLFHFAANAANGCGTKTGILPSLYDGLCSGGGSDITISGLSDVLLIVGNVVRILIALSGGLAIVVIMVSAVFYVTSAGDPGQIKKAKDTLLNTIIGLVLIIASYAIVTYIVGGLS